MRYYLILYGLLLAIGAPAQDMMRFPTATSRPEAPLPECLRKASRLFESAPTIKEAPMLREYARQLLALGQRDYAKDIFERLVVLNQDTYGKKDERYVRSLVDLASAYVLLIRYQEAAGLFEEALPSAKAIKGATSPFYLEVLNEAGFCHSRLQQWSQGLLLFSEALSVVEQRNLRQSTLHIVVLNNLGACYQNLQQGDKALSYYKRAFDLASGTPRLALNVAANLAALYLSSGQVGKATPLLQRYEPQIKTYCPSPSIETARIWTQYAAVHLKLGEFEAAETCLQNGFVANSLTLSEVTNLPAQAEHLMDNNQFLAVCAQAGLMLYSIELYKARYEQTKELTALEDGYKLVRSMTRFGEQLMGSYLAEANKLILFRLGASILFDRSLYYAYQLHQITKDKKYLEDAFFYSERSKSTLLTHALRSKDKQTLVELPEQVAATRKAYVKQFKNLQKEKIEAVGTAEQERVQREINEINVQIERFKDDIKNKYPEYYEYRYEKNLTSLRDVQAFLEKGDRAMIEYALGVQYNYAFLVTKNTIRMIELIFDPQELATKTQELRMALTDYNFVVKQKEQSRPAYEAAARYFYQTFAKELVELTLINQSLIIVPDQQLGHLPFETFLTTATIPKSNLVDLPYLLKRNPISYSYSATILLNQAQRKSKRSISEKGVLAFAANYPNVGTNSFSHQRGGDLGRLREGLEPLPGAEQEVAVMEENLDGAFYKGINASEKNFKAEAGKYSIIHLAMHGILNPTHPILSSLVFTEDSSEVEDNFLRAYEIAQLDLNADLVVLSACETGYGKFQQGEGVMSLAHSFAYAGASSVLMSLWQVNDLSTKAIMKNYYTNLAQHYSKETALHNAKLQYLEAQGGSILSHPAFWAAFVQTGDTAPMELMTKADRRSRRIRYLVIGLFGCLVVGIGYGLYRSFK